MGNWYIVLEVLNKSCRHQTPKDFTKYSCFLVLNIFAQRAPLEGLTGYFLIYCVSEESQLTSLSYIICLYSGKVSAYYMCNQDLFLYDFHLILKCQLTLLQMDKMREGTLVIMLNIFSAFSSLKIRI